MKNFLIIALMLMTDIVHASATRTLDGQQITNNGAVLTIPTVTDTLAGISQTQTLTNKTMTGAANSFSLIPVTAIGNGSVLSGTNTGDVTIGTANGLSVAGQAISLQLASGSQNGALSSADYTSFTNKLSNTLTNGNIFVGSAGNVATGVAVTGDVTISNAGVTAIGATKVTAAMQNSGAASSGAVLTANGSGGASYLAPASTVPSISGTDASPTTVTAAGGIAFTGTAYENYYFVTAASAITVSATPQIAAGTNVGQRLVLTSKSATNTITLADGNGLSLNGTWVGGLDSVLILYWNGNAKWVEISRR